MNRALSAADNELPSLIKNTEDLTQLARHSEDLQAITFT